MDKQKDMLEFIDRPIESLVGDKPSQVSPERDDLAGFVECIVKAADGRKGEDIVAIRTSSISTLQSFVVIVSGNSRPQNQAISAAILDDVEEEFGVKPGSTGVPEGTADSGWIVLDYGTVVIHLFDEESREYYQLEQLWAGAKAVDLSSLQLDRAVD